MRRSAFHGLPVLHLHLRKGPIRGGRWGGNRCLPKQTTSLAARAPGKAEPGTVNFSLSKVQGRVIRRSL